MAVRRTCGGGRNGRLIRSKSVDHRQIHQAISHRAISAHHMYMNGRGPRRGGRAADDALGAAR